MPFPNIPSYPWTAWEAEGYDAIEIWNHMSAWMELLKRINVLKMIIHAQTRSARADQKDAGQVGRAWPKRATSPVSVRPMFMRMPTARDR